MVWLGFGAEVLSRRSTIIARGNWSAVRPMAEVRGERERASARDERPRCTNKRGRGEGEEKRGRMNFMKSM